MLQPAQLQRRRQQTLPPRSRHRARLMPALPPRSGCRTPRRPRYPQRLPSGTQQPHLSRRLSKRESRQPRLSMRRFRHREALPHPCPQQSGQDKAQQPACRQPFGLQQPQQHRCRQQSVLDKLQQPVYPARYKFQQPQQLVYPRVSPHRARYRLQPACRLLSAKRMPLPRPLILQSVRPALPALQSTRQSQRNAPPAPRPVLPCPLPSRFRPAWILLFSGWQSQVRRSVLMCKPTRRLRKPRSTCWQISGVALAWISPIRWCKVLLL